MIPGDSVGIARRELLLALYGVALSRGAAAATPAVDDPPRSIADFGAAGDGVQDDAPALARALREARHIVFPAPKRHYLFRSEVEVTLPETSVIDFGGHPVVSAGGTVHLLAPRISSRFRLVEPVAPNAMAVSLAGAEALAPGDLLYLTSNATPSPEWPDTKKDCALVAAARDRRVMLVERCRFGYDPDEAGLDILAYRPVGLRLLGLNLRFEAGRDSPHRSALFCEGMRHVLVDRPVIRGPLDFDPARDISRVGIKLYRIWNWEVRSGRYEAMSYPIGVYGGSRHGIEHDAQADFCRHGHADVGDWSASYRLSGLRSFRCQGAVNTHPSFDVHIMNADTRADTALANMRCIGGSFRDSRVNCIATPETPQFQSVPLRPAFRYLYDDADFEIDNVRYDNPRYTNNPEVLVRFGRRLTVSGLHCFALACGAPGDPIDRLVLGKGNWFGATHSSRPYMPALHARAIQPAPSASNGSNL